MSSTVHRIHTRFYGTRGAIGDVIYAAGGFNGTIGLASAPWLKWLRVPN